MPPLDGVCQVALPPETGARVQQYPVEPDIVSERGQHGATSSGPAIVELQIMSAEEVAGVPSEMQLTVRGDQGAAVYLPRMIRMEEIRLAPAQFDIALREVPREALVNGSVWSVFVVFASEFDAPTW